MGADKVSSACRVLVASVAKAPGGLLLACCPVRDTTPRQGPLGGHTAQRNPHMSNINEWMEEHQGQVNALGHLAAINQRNRQIEQQKEQAAALRAQTAVLEKQSRIEQDRARIEQQRLDIERQRLAAEDADREMRRQQAEQVRELRNLMAEASVSLARLRRARLA